MSKIAEYPLTREDRVKEVFRKLDLTDCESGNSIGGTLAMFGDGNYLTSYDPTTGLRIGKVLITPPLLHEDCIREAQKAFLKWSEVPAPKRGDVIGALGRAFQEKLEPLAELIAIEMGKTVNEGRGEVIEFIHMCEFAQGLSRQLGGTAMQSERAKHRMFEQWHPLGIVGIFSAFNFPVAVLGWNRCLSAICGNVDIWKPSSLTPFTSIAVQKICNKVAAKHGHPGIFNMVIGSGETIGKMMLEDKRVPLISFTGSTETGRIVARTVAERFGKTILELGGNNAVIVEPDADLDIAVRVLTFGVIGTAGQRCTSTRRLIVHESVADELIGRLRHAFSQVKIGDPLNKETHMGPLINAQASKIMNSAAASALEQGGKIELLCLPTICTAVNPRFVYPAIIRMPSQTPIVKTETFAPILYVMTYKTLEEAIAMNNDVPQGLSSAIISRSFESIEHFLSVHGSDCGIANVNCAPSGAEIGGAFGGEKETGGGREAGSDSWKQYMRRQTCTKFWGKASEMTLAQGIKFDVK